jgi:Mg2+ and Co2+ transporter CorA
MYCFVHIQFSLRLDISRNEALMANTVLGILGAAIGFGGYITGVFGMNLDQVYYLMPRQGSFLAVTLASFGVIVLIFLAVYTYFAMLGVFPSRLLREK